MRKMFSEKQIQELVKNTKGYNIVNLVDSQCHDRFIEGVGVVPETTGWTEKYNKWSLSGTHLMFVLSIDFANGITLGNEKLCEYTIPKWIYDKIATLFLDRVIIIASVSLFDNAGGSQQTYNVSLRKADDKIAIYNSNSLTLTADRNLRLQFDLLIDSD